MKGKWIIYISAIFVVGLLILRNPAPYQLATNRLTEWFGKTFSAFGRVA